MDPHPRGSQRDHLVNTAEVELLSWAVALVDGKLTEVVNVPYFMALGYPKPPAWRPQRPNLLSDLLCTQGAFQPPMLHLLDRGLPDFLGDVN